MRKVISALVCIFAVAYAGIAFADDLSSAIQSQADVANHARSAADKKAKSEELGREALTIEKEVFYAFYRQAAKAGVQFEVVSIPPRQESAGVAIENRTVESLEGGRFIVNQSCFLGCEVTPYVNVSGTGLVGLSMIFDGPNKEPSGCGGGYGEQSPSLTCSCRFAAFNSNLSMPCATVFDRSKRDVVTRKIVAWLNKNLALDLKQRAHLNQ